MGDTAVDIAGFGLPGKEVTLAEVLSELEEPYQTHVDSLG